jgi:hypothetical protein
MLSMSGDSDADGVINYSKTYQYDSMGNVLFTFSDDNGDGTTDVINAFDYSCWT